MKPILTLANKTHEKFLRKKTIPFPFLKFSKKEITVLLKEMREAMKSAQGIGLSANQIGLEHKVFVALVPQAQGAAKFYAVFNPKLEKTGNEVVPFEEGCLSVPGVTEEVTRSEHIEVHYQDRFGKTQRMGANGLFAVAIQHENDHLDGVLFIEKLSPLKRRLVKRQLSKAVTL